MKVVVRHGKGDVRVDQVNDPEILDPRDIIIQVTASGICGSDLHLFDRMMPTMEESDGPCTGRTVRTLGHHASCPRPDAIRHSGNRIAPRLIDSESLS